MIHPLRCQITGSRSQITGFRSQIRPFRHQITGLRSVIRSLRGRITAPRTQNTSVRCQITRLRTLIRPLRGRITGLRSLIRLSRCLIRSFRPLIRVRRSLCRWLRHQSTPPGRLNTDAGVESAQDARPAGLNIPAIHELRLIATISESSGHGRRRKLRSCPAGFRGTACDSRLRGISNCPLAVAENQPGLLVIKTA